MSHAESSRGPAGRGDGNNALKRSYPKIRATFDPLHIDEHNAKIVRNQQGREIDVDPDEPTKREVVTDGNFFVRVHAEDSSGLFVVHLYARDSLVKKRPNVSNNNLTAWYMVNKPRKGESNVAKEVYQQASFPEEAFPMGDDMDGSFARIFPGYSLISTFGPKERSQELADFNEALGKEAIASAVRRVMANGEVIGLDPKRTPCPAVELDPITEVELYKGFQGKYSDEMTLSVAHYGSHPTMTKEPDTSTKKGETRKDTVQLMLYLLDDEVAEDKWEPAELDKFRAQPIVERLLEPPVVEPKCLVGSKQKFRPPSLYSNGQPVIRPEPLQRWQSVGELELETPTGTLEVGGQYRVHFALFYETSKWGTGGPLLIKRPKCSK